MKLKEYLPGIFIYMILGIAVGAIAKFLDTVPVDGSRLNDFLSYAANMMTRLGIWVFFVIIIAVFSKTALKAAVHTFLFFAGMLISYYVYSAQLFGFFPTGYFLYWGAAALATPVLAVISWFGRHDLRLAHFLPALPLGLLLSLSLGIGFFYIDLVYIDEFIMFLLAGVLFYKNPRQMALAAVLSFAAAILISMVFPLHF